MAVREALTARVVAVIQARTGSQRLPGKVLADLCGRPLISRVLERAQRASRVEEVMLATSDQSQDDGLADLARDLGVRCHRGSEADVLRRMRDAADAAAADAVVRLTGDCPLLDPELIDRVVAALLDGDQPCDYASNVLRRTYPKGLDAEAMHIDVLRRVDRLATSAAAREHVTWFIHRERPELFILRSIESEEDLSALNWSVDDAVDLERVRALYSVNGLDREPLGWRALARAAAP